MVIAASPAFAVADMLEGFDPAVSGVLRQIPYSSMTVICFGYERERIAHRWTVSAT